MKKHDVAVCIGRWQLFHNGQLHLVRRGLEVAQRCVVIIGSAYQARSSKNPFTWEERADMIRLALTEEERLRVRFAPVRDFYDQRRWADAVRQAVRHAAGGEDLMDVALIGHRKDPTSEYLNDFPGWKLVDVGLQGDLHATAFRAAVFAPEQAEAGLAAIAGQVPSSTIEFLRAWTQLPDFQALRTEWLAVAAEKAKWAGAPYTPIFVTVDAVVRMSDHVLLIRRGRAPGMGLLALPGGFLEPRETVYQSAVRELREETGLKLLDSDMEAALRSVRVFDHPDRSQRGRVITHAHYFAFGVAHRLPEIAGLDDASEAMWVPISELAQLESQFHDDHFHILDSFLNLL